MGSCRCSLQYSFVKLAIKQLISCFFLCQAAMMFFELAWVLTKDTKDMLW